MWRKSWELIITGMWSKIWSGVPTLAISGYFWLFYQIQKYFLKISYFLKSDCWWNTWIWRKSWEPRGCSCCKLCQQQFPPNLFSLKFYKCASVISDIRELLFSCPFLSICVYGILYKNWYHILVSSSTPHVCIIKYIPRYFMSVTL